MGLDNKRRGRILAVAAVIAAAHGLPGAARAMGTCLVPGKAATISGFVLTGDIPGPPDYESIKGGDAALTAVFLLLGEPVCVDGDAGLEADPVASTQILQLACPEETFPQVTRRGERITLSGTIFTAHTGYHRTEALLQCR